MISQENAASLRAGSSDLLALTDQQVSVYFLAAANRLGKGRVSIAVAYRNSDASQSHGIKK